MWRRTISTVLVFAMLCGGTFAQEKAVPGKVKVAIQLAAEHAPEAVKANNRANLMFVVSSVKSRTGKVVYSTKRVFDGVEVVSVKREAKPADPEKAVFVELQVTREQAEKIEKLKSQFVTISGTDDSGKRFTKMRPVPLRLEPASRSKE